MVPCPHSRSKVHSKRLGLGLGLGLGVRLRLRLKLRSRLRLGFGLSHRLVSGNTYLPNCRTYYGCKSICCI